MPRRLVASFRRFALLGAFLQLVVPSALAVADGAQAAAVGQVVASHVEAPGGTSCPRVHPPGCAICQAVSAPAAPGRPPLPLVAREGDQPRPEASLLLALRDRSAGCERTRAPPAHA